MKYPMVSRANCVPTGKKGWDTYPQLKVRTQGEALGEALDGETQPRPTEVCIAGGGTELAVLCCSECSFASENPKSEPASPSSGTISVVLIV